MTHRDDAARMAGDDIDLLAYRLMDRPEVDVRHHADHAVGRRAGSKDLADRLLRPDDAEVAKLKRELAKTKAERDILKKAIAYFAKDPQ